MNRRSFLGTLALLPGLGAIDPESAQRDVDTLVRSGADAGSLLHAMIADGWRVTRTEFDACAMATTYHLTHASGWMVHTRHHGAPRV